MSIQRWNNSLKLTYLIIWHWTRVCYAYCKQKAELPLAFLTLWAYFSKQDTRFRRKKKRQLFRDESDDDDASDDSFVVDDGVEEFESGADSDDDDDSSDTPESQAPVNK